MVTSHIKIEEIDHRAVAHPVNQIPRRPAGNQAEGVQIERTAVSVLPEGKTDKNQGAAGDQDEKIRLPGRVGIGQQPECRAPVVQIGQIKKTGHHRFDLMQAETGHDEPFAQLIGDDDQPGQQKQQ